MLQIVLDPPFRKSMHKLSKPDMKRQDDDRTVAWLSIDSQ